MEFLSMGKNDEILSNNKIIKTHFRFRFRQRIRNDGSNVDLTREFHFGSNDNKKMYQIIIIILESIDPGSERFSICIFFFQPEQ